jgi:hypothetical protein
VTPEEQRQVVIRAIQRTRLSGADRVVHDDYDTDKPERYAHIYQSAVSTNLHTTSDPDQPHVAYDNQAWRFLGVIDLDNGALVRQHDDS